MSQANLNNKRILWFGDLVHPSGFGRIGNEVCKRLVARGWSVLGMSIPWNGYPLNPLPFQVIPMGGVDIWTRLTQVANTEKPDVIVVCQDFPYAQTAFHGCRIDWSQHKFLIVTPIDGTPIHPEWLRMVDLADGTAVISRFGAEGMRLEGRKVDLLHPGADTHEFYPASGPEEVAALRAKLGIAPDAFVVGMFAMNQGRKCVSQTVAVFHEFAREKTNAVLYLDMDETSPAGWDIPALCHQIDPHGDILRLGKTVLFKRHALEAGLSGLRERYLLCDINSVVSHREGFGLPLLEGMACKVPAMALDWCSGSEICGGGKGALVRRVDYMEYGTWGHARDAFPDMQDWLDKLNVLYYKPAWRTMLAERGYEWAIQQTWDRAADQFEAMLKRAMAQEKEPRADEPDKRWYIPAPQFGDAGDAQPVSDRPGVQPPAISVPLSAELSSNGRPEQDGDTGAGRLQPGIQPGRAAADAGSTGSAE